MKITDPISDMLTRIRNANAANKAEVSMPSTKVLVEIARVICEEGYIAGYEVEDTTPQKTLHITLKYGARHAKVIRGIRRISKPGLRIYSTAEKLPRVLGGLGTANGALIGSLVIGIVADMSSLVIPNDMRYASALAILIIVLLVRPQGIFGKQQRVG